MLVLERSSSDVVRRRPCLSGRTAARSSPVHRPRIAVIAGSQKNHLYQSEYGIKIAPHHDAGNYAVRGMAFGSYRNRLRGQGFRSTSQGHSLNVAQTLTIDITLESARWTRRSRFQAPRVIEGRR